MIKKHIKETIYQIFNHILDLDAKNTDRTSQRKAFEDTINFILTEKRLLKAVAFLNLSYFAFFIAFNFLIYLIVNLTEELVFLKILFIIGFLHDVFIFVKVKRIPLLLVFTIFMMLMDLYFSFYLLTGIPISESIYEKYFSIYNLSTYLLIVNLFKISFFHFIKPSSIYIPLRSKVKKYNSTILFYLIYTITFTLVIFKIDGEVIYFTSNPYESYIRNLENSSGLSEYLIIFYIILWLFETKRHQRVLLQFLFIVIGVKLFLLGFRVQMLMYVMLFYILYLDKYYKVYKVVFFIFLGYAFSFIFGIAKEIGFEKLFSIDFLMNVNLISHNPEFVLSHFTGVITSSLVVIEEMSFNIFTSIGFILNTFIPPVILQKILPQAQPPVYVSEYITRIPGGVYFPVFFYTSFWFLGPIIFGIFISWIFNKAFNALRPSNFFTIYSIIIFSTLPRWFFYTQTDYLFRFLFTFLFSFHLIVLVYNSIRFIRFKHEK
jgi:hypothetical protein